MLLFRVCWWRFKSGAWSWQLDRLADASLTPWLIFVCPGIGTSVLSVWVSAKLSAQLNKKERFSHTGHQHRITSPPETPGGAFSLSPLAPPSASWPEASDLGPPTARSPLSPRYHYLWSWLITSFGSSEEDPRLSSTLPRLTFLKWVLFTEALVKKIFFHSCKEKKKDSEWTQRTDLWMPRGREWGRDGVGGWG